MSSNAGTERTVASSLGSVATNRLETKKILSLRLVANMPRLCEHADDSNGLGESSWMDKMSAEDFRTLTPLIYAHVNLFGAFGLAMDKRLPIDFVGHAVARYRR